MDHRARIGLGILALVVAGGAAMTLLRPSPVIPFAEDTTRVSNEPALCPWREPEQDLRRFFPRATTYRTELFALSRFRAEILRRLGPGARIESLSLHVYRILRGTDTIGAVMVKRFSAPHGAMEVVVAVDPPGHLAGVRIQRHREPAQTLSAITSPSWLSAFARKTADSTIRIGDDLPQVPLAARETAEAMAAAVRERLIEYTVGAQTPGIRHH